MKRINAKKAIKRLPFICLTWTIYNSFLFACGLARINDVGLDQILKGFLLFYCGGAIWLLAGSIIIDLEKWLEGYAFFILFGVAIYAFLVNIIPWSLWLKNQTPARALYLALAGAFGSPLIMFLEPSRLQTGLTGLAITIGSYLIAIIFASQFSKQLGKRGIQSNGDKESMAPAHSHYWKMHRLKKSVLILLETLFIYNSYLIFFFIINQPDIPYKQFLVSPGFFNIIWMWPYGIFKTIIDVASHPLQDLVFIIYPLVALAVSVCPIIIWLKRRSILTAFVLACSGCVTIPAIFLYLNDMKISVTPYNLLQPLIAMLLCYGYIGAYSHIFSAMLARLTSSGTVIILNGERISLFTMRDNYVC